MTYATHLSKNSPIPPLPHLLAADVDKNRIWDLLGLVEPHPVRVDPHDEHSSDDPSQQSRTPL